jgi:hypothetical protein
MYISRESRNSSYVRRASINSQIPSPHSLVRRQGWRATQKMDLVDHAIEGMDYGNNHGL